MEGRPGGGAAGMWAPEGRSRLGCSLPLPRTWTALSCYLLVLEDLVVWRPEPPTCSEHGLQSEGKGDRAAASSRNQGMRKLM